MNFQKVRAKREEEMLAQMNNRHPAASHLYSTGMSKASSHRSRPPVHPITGQVVVEEPKITMPLRGKAVAVTNQLQEMHERRERMEMMNYQQKMVN